MNLPIPDVRVGEPQMCGGVAVFPLFNGLPLFSGTSANYILASEAMAAGTLIVQEVSDAGEVPCLLVNNSGDQPILFIEGEEVRGGKQNRVLCSSILAAEMSPTRIPVACTELRRWKYDNRQFTAGSHCPPSLRYCLKEGTHDRQSRIWTTIRQKHCRLGVRSRTENMSDVMETHGEKVAELRDTFRYVDGASGIAVAVGGTVVSVDIFDKPATCKEVWSKVVESLLLDALESCNTERQPDENSVSVKLYKAKVMRWQKVEPVVGLGEAYRARYDDTLATALVVDDTILHLSMSMPSIS